MTLFSKIFKLPIYVHLLAIAATSCIAVYIVLKSIDVYTNHNQAVNVPDVRGLQIEDARPFFEDNILKYTVIDSIYSKDDIPGAIVELLPEANSKVKKNRIIYVTINAKTEETASIPEVKDISYRQAYALLKTCGFLYVEFKYVTGEYRDLTVGVEYGGIMMERGTRVPLTANLILVVSDGNIVAESDSLATDSIDISGDRDNWF